MVQINTPVSRRVLFAALYFSEGAPIGFLWWALPTRLRAAGVPIEEITSLTALLALPWALKFLWAPVIDRLHFRGWGLRRSVVVAQIVMAASLTPLIGLDPAAHLNSLSSILLIHAIAAATQDVAIDAWCVQLTSPDERGRVNGWMQAGMLVGRSLLGGGALVLANHVGDSNVILVLMGAILASLVLVLTARIPNESGAGERPADDVAPRSLIRALLAVGRAPVTWLALGFALTAGAAFEGLGALQGPMLHDLGWTEQEVGWWLAIPVVAGMVAGSILGGRWADRHGHGRVAAAGLLAVAALVSFSAALVNTQDSTANNRLLMTLLGVEALAVGVLTASSYALLMGLCARQLAGTQFSLYMAAGNACEIWAGWLAGRMAGRIGYAGSLWVLSGLSLIGLVFLFGIHWTPSVRRSHRNP